MAIDFMTPKGAVANSDPTMTFLAKFEDPEAWEKIEYGIPIFIPHEANHIDPTSGQATVKVDYDVARLQQMVDIMQQKIRKNAVPPRMTLGHSMSAGQVKQQAQPDPVGYWWNPRIGTFGPEKTPAIIADRYWLPGKYEEGKTYPYRSAEFYPKEVCKLAPGQVAEDKQDWISAVSLLKTDPRLDMGVTGYAQFGLLCCYGMLNAPEPMPGGMDEESNMAVDPAMTPGNPPQPGQMPNPSVGPATTPDDKTYAEFCQYQDRYMLDRYPAFPKYYQDVCAKYGTPSSSAMSAPTATNTELPGEPEGGEKKPPFPPKAEAKSDDKPPPPKGDDDGPPKKKPEPEQSMNSQLPLPSAQPTIAPVGTTVTPDVIRQYQDQMTIMKANYERAEAAMKASKTEQDARLAAAEAKIRSSEMDVFLAKYETALGVKQAAGKMVVTAEEVAECREAISAMPNPTDWSKWTEKQLNRIQTKYGDQITNPELGKVNGQQIISNSAMGIPDDADKVFDSNDTLPAVHYQEASGLKFTQVSAMLVEAKAKAKVRQKANPRMSWEDCLFAELPAVKK